MNEAMTVSRHGLLLLASFEGKPRTKARRCEGGRYELSYGCTTWPPAPGEAEGRPIGPADVCTEDQALQLFAYHLKRFEAVVEKHVTVPLNQFQYDAHVSLAYNIGEGQYAKSSVLRLTNEGNWAEAAASFGMYVFATSPGPSDVQMKMAEHKGQWRMGPKGAEWIGPEGQACEWRQALDGLLRRHHSEGLLSLGLPWEPVCTQAFIFLDAERHWNAAKGRWEDTVMDCRTFAACKAKAETLPKLQLDLPPATKVTIPAPAPTVAVDAKVAPPATIPAPGTAKPVPGPPIQRQPGLPAPVPPPPLEYQVPRGAPMPTPPPPAKPMDATRRFWGAFLYYGGKIFMLLGVTTLPGKWAVAFGETWGAVVKDPQLFGMAIDALCFSTGFFADHCGAWIRKWGERRATRPMVSGGERHPPIVVTEVSTQTALVQTQTLEVSTTGGA